MSSLLDSTTRICNRAFDTLLLQHPTRTSLGIALGLVLDGLRAFFGPSLSRLTWASTERIHLWHLIAAGVVVVHLPTFLHAVRHRPLGQEQIDGIISIIEKANLPQDEKRTEYRRLLQRVIESVALAEPMQRKIRDTEAVDSPS